MTTFPRKSFQNVMNIRFSSIDHDLLMSVVVCVTGAVCGQSTEDVNLAQGDINRFSVGHAWLVHTCTQAKLHTHKRCTSIHTNRHTHTFLVTGDFVSLIGVWTGGAGVLSSFILEVGIVHLRCTAFQMYCR